MDNSKEFQLMLDKAIECEPLAFKDFDRTKNVQGQLQEMVRNKYYIYKLEDIFKSVRDFGLTKYHHSEKEFPFSSMEQLWLAFVMKENHNKIWKDGWVLSV